MPTSVSNRRPVACITAGYPAGIGPEAITGALASQKIKRLANFLIVGDSFVFEKLRGKGLRYRRIKNPREIKFSKEDNIVFLDMGGLRRKDFRFGIVNASCGKASIGYITEAVSLIKAKKADVLITAPIHKYAAELSGFRFPGHTEYLAYLTGTRDFAMMFKGGPLKVVLATIHIPLKKVPPQISKDSIFNKIILTDASLKRYFGIESPRIAVCGLNPHAGERGIIGEEEIKIIAPAVKAAQRRNVKSFGPLPADVVFHDLYKKIYDAAICMYHDQGLVALKMVARDEAVNITLGLPFIRTSPAHGTALDIAGKNRACCESMEQAITTAVSMFNGR